VTINPSEAVPPGYAPYSRASPFLQYVGPLYLKLTGDTFTFAIRIGQRHLNGRGTAHGGVIAGFADMVMGYAAFETSKRFLSTVSLTVDFVAPVHDGDWLEAQARIISIGRRLASVDCTIHVAERAVGRASAVFATHDHPPSDAR